MEANTQKMTGRNELSIRLEIEECRNGGTPRAEETLAYGGRSDQMGNSSR